ncbi:break repair meiotic recombinase recruitment factor 1 [Echinops telfairi]|uniref:Break repair meiotic recombinase recruitment factor 1 n=1 Tax=Echinops telfairi TaxID=9371 RepID=A0AC55D1L9_ECHTE|nr:break repair meiotic recombinase recruitment factor 1 [Echinops telfairi]
MSTHLSLQGIYSLKPPKKPKLDSLDRAHQSPELDCLPALEESKDTLGPSSPAEPNDNQARAAASSTPDEDTEVPTRQPKKDMVPFPLSQNSVGKFVPQFSKSRKTVTRQTEDIESGAFNLETLLEPTAPKGGSQQLQASLELAASEQSQLHCQELPLEPGPGSGACLLGTSTYSSFVSERASQPPLSEPSRVCALDRGCSSSEPGSPVEQPGDSGLASQGPAQEGSRPSSESKGRDPHGEGPHEEGSDVPGTSGPAQGESVLEPGSAAQVHPEYKQSPSQPLLVTTDRSTDPTAPPLEPPKGGILGGQAPDSGFIGALLSNLEASGETRPKDQSLSNDPGPPAASPAPVHRNQEPTVDVGDPWPLVPAASPGADSKLMPGPTQEGQAGTCMLPSPEESEGGKAAKSSSDGQPAPESSGRGLPLQATSPPAPREVLDGPQGPGACSAPDAVDQSVWVDALPMELDFLPDSQMQDALDCPDFQAPHEQACPGGSRPPANRAPITTVQPRWGATGPCNSSDKGFEGPNLEDATATVCGLVLELSNLNRLIMSTHRDLEAVRRLSYRQANLAGKPAAPYASKGAGSHSRGEPPWRDA